LPADPATFLADCLEELFGIHRPKLWLTILPVDKPWDNIPALIHWQPLHPRWKRFGRFQCYRFVCHGFSLSGFSESILLVSSVMLPSLHFSHTTTQKSLSFFATTPVRRQPLLLHNFGMRTHAGDAFGFS